MSASPAMPPVTFDVISRLSYILHLMELLAVYKLENQNLLPVSRLGRC